MRWHFGFVICGVALPEGMVQAGRAQLGQTRNMLDHPSHLVANGAATLPRIVANQALDASNSESSSPMNKTPLSFTLNRLLAFSLSTGSELPTH